MAFRYDASRLEKVQRTPAGYIRVDANVTMPGVFSYTGPDGKTRREYRPPEEVFKAESIASLRDATVTNLHPPVRVDAKNAKKYSIGHQSGEPKQTPTGIATAIVINDADGIARVDSKDLQECSCGYDMREDHTPGLTPAGEHYDLVQRDILYNHIALGPQGWGRQGSSVSLRLDSNGDQTEHVEEKKKSKMKVQLRIDGKDLEFEAGSTEHLQAQSLIDSRNDARIKELETANTTQLAKIDSLTADNVAKDKTLAEAKARQDAAEAEQKKLARGVLENAAKKILGDMKLDGLSDDDIRIAAIKKQSPEFTTDGKDAKTLPVYLAARFDLEIEKSVRADGDSGSIATELEGVGPKVRRDGKETTYKIDAQNPDPDAARAAMVSATQNSWKRPERKAV